MERRHYPGKLFPAPAQALAAAWLALALAGCGGTGSVARHAPPPRVVLPKQWPAINPEQPEQANAVLMRALSLVGTPYRYGGNTPETGFDCSGLVGYVFGDVLARRLPRSSIELARIGTDIGLDRMSTGDLVVFGDSRAVNHVGIYVGEGRFVHAPSSGGTVRLDRIDGAYWRDHVMGARRVLL